MAQSCVLYLNEQVNPFSYRRLASAEGSKLSRSGAWCRLISAQLDVQSLFLVPCRPDQERGCSPDGTNFAINPHHFAIILINYSIKLITLQRAPICFTAKCKESTEN